MAARDPMSDGRYFDPMRWQAILLGVVASWTGVAHADCVGIEMVTYGDPGEVTCLPWVDWGTPRIETIPPRFREPRITVFDASGVEALGAQDISDITRFDPWCDIPELDER